MPNKIWKNLVGKTIKSVEDHPPFSMMDEDAIKIICTDGTEYVIGIWTPHGNGGMEIEEFK